MKGFSPKWIKWLETLITGGSVAINVNYEIGHFFKQIKGFVKETLFRSLLFNIVDDMLTILITRIKEDGRLSEVVPIVDGGLSFMQYLFME